MKNIKLEIVSSLQEDPKKQQKEERNESKYSKN